MNNLPAHTSNGTASDPCAAPSLERIPSPKDGCSQRFQYYFKETEQFQGGEYVGAIWQSEGEWSWRECMVWPVKRNFKGEASTLQAAEAYMEARLELAMKGQYLND